MLGAIEMRNFSKVVKKNVEPFLNDKGFTYSDGQFVKEQPNGIRTIIAFDNGGIDNESFQIIIFMNSVDLDNDQGAHCVTYFTGGSISKEGRKLPCNNIEVLNGRLERFVDSYDEIIESYISSFETCADIADALSNDKGLSSYRGDLYLLSGKKGNAKKAYKEWLAYLPTMSHLDNEAITNAVNATKQNIKRCGLFARA